MNLGAQKGGRRRVENTTPEQRQAIAALGGKMTWQRLTPEQRTQKIKSMTEKRWSKSKTLDSSILT